MKQLGFYILFCLWLLTAIVSGKFNLYNFISFCDAFGFLFCLAVFEIFREGVIALERNAVKGGGIA